MIIRQEKIKDYDDVYHVVKEAFESAEHSDGNEQDLVVELRKSKSFIPELSLVIKSGVINAMPIRISLRCMLMTRCRAMRLFA